MYSKYVLIPFLGVLFNISLVQSVRNFRCKTAECYSYQSSSPFNGVCLPAYTPFTEDGEVNYELIPSYVKYLSDQGYKCIFVSTGDTGGYTIGYEKRLKSIQVFVDAGKRCGMTVIPQVGGQALTEVMKMARAVGEMDVAAIAVQADIYYKTNSTSLIAQFTCQIGSTSGTKVFFFDDSVRMGVSQNMAKLWTEAIKHCPKCFGGVITDFDTGLAVLATNQVSEYSIFVIRWEVTASAFASCLNGTADVATNIFPRDTLRIERYVKNGLFKRATELQLRRNQVLKNIYGAVNIYQLDATTVPLIYSALRYAASVSTKIDFGWPPSSLLIEPLTQRQKRLIRKALRSEHSNIEVY